MMRIFLFLILSVFQFSAFAQNEIINSVPVIVGSGSPNDNPKIAIIDSSIEGWFYRDTVSVPNIIYNYDSSVGGWVVSNSLKTNWNNEIGESNANTNLKINRDNPISIGSIKSNALINTDISFIDSTAFSTIIKTDEEQKILSVLDSFENEIYSFRVKADEGAMMLGSPMPALTYNNEKIASFVSFATGDSGKKLIYPLASTLIGFNGLVDCVDCNSFVANGYQAGHLMKTGKNFTIQGTDVAYNFWKLEDSNISGRHSWFMGNGSVLANGKNINFIGNDGFEKDTLALSVTGFGNSTFSNALDVKYMHIEGDGIARYRSSSSGSSLGGFQTAGSITLLPNQAGIFNSQLNGFRNTTNADSVAYTVSEGHQSGYFNTYNSDYDVFRSVRSGAFSAMNMYGNDNVNMGYRSGAFSTPNNRNRTVTIGYRAGDGWINDDELAVENSNSSSPLIYGNFLTNILRTNGKFQVSTVDTDNTNSNVLVWNSTSGELEINTSLGGAAQNIFTNDGVINSGDSRTVTLNDNIRFNGESFGINEASNLSGQLHVDGKTLKRAIFSENNSASLPTITAFQSGNAYAGQFRNFSGGGALFAQSNTGRSIYSINSATSNTTESALFQRDADENNAIQNVIALNTNSVIGGGDIGHGGRIQMNVDNSSDIVIGIANINYSLLDPVTGRSNFTIGVAGSNQSNISSDAISISGEDGDLVDHVKIGGDFEIEFSDTITSSQHSYVLNPITKKVSLQEILGDNMGDMLATDSLDMSNFEIINLADGTTPQSAATVKQLSELPKTIPLYHTGIGDVIPVNLTGSNPYLVPLADAGKTLTRVNASTQTAQNDTTGGALTVNIEIVRAGSVFATYTMSITDTNTTDFTTGTTVLAENDIIYINAVGAATTVTEGLFATLTIQ